MQLASWELDEACAAHLNVIYHMCHSMKKVKNFKYSEMLPKEAIHSKYKTVTVHPGDQYWR